MGCALWSLSLVVVMVIVRVRWGGARRGGGGGVAFSVICLCVGLVHVRGKSGRGVSPSGELVLQEARYSRRHWMRNGRLADWLDTRFEMRMRRKQREAPFSSLTSADL